VQCIEALTHRLGVHGDGNDDAERYVEEMVALVTGYLAAPPAAAGGAVPAGRA
jgi:hypothetical protein